MPYIPPEDRPCLDRIIYRLGRAVPLSSPGRLAYVLFGWFRRYIKPSFLSFCIVFGAIVLTLLEMWKVVVGPYEVGKKESNGDVN